MPEIPPVREDMRREHAEVCRELELAHAQNDTLRDVVRKLVERNERVVSDRVDRLVRSLGGG